jgi:hypothetical protein
MSRPLKKTLIQRFKDEMVTNPNQSRTYAQWLHDGIDEALKEDNYEWAIRLTDILFRYEKSNKGKSGTP